MALVAHWKFADGRGHIPGVASDETGNHDGLYWNLTEVAGGLQPGGIGGTHLRINTTSGGHVDTIDSPSELRITGEMTIMCWLHTTTVYDAYIASCSSTGSGADNNTVWELLRPHNTETLRMYWQHSSGTAVTVQPSASYIADKGWYHIAVVRKLHDGGPTVDVEFWINGVLEDTMDNGGAGYTPPSGGVLTTPYVGRADGPTSAIQLLDSLRIYNSDESSLSIGNVYTNELADREITAVFAGELGVRENIGYTR